MDTDESPNDFMDEDIEVEDEDVDVYNLEDLIRIGIPDFNPVEYNIQRRERAKVLWNVNRTQAKRILRRHELPESKAYRERQAALGQPDNRRYMVGGIQLDPPIPPREYMPMYRNYRELNQPNPPPAPEVVARDVPATDVVTANQDVISDIQEFIPNFIENERIPQRYLARLFANQTQAFTFRRFLFGMNIPNEVYENNQEFAADVASVIFILLLYSVFKLINTPGRTADNLADFTRNLNVTVPQSIRQKRIWWSCSIYSGNENRLSGFELGISYADVLRRIGKMIYNLIGDIKIELTLIYESTLPQLRAERANRAFQYTRIDYLELNEPYRNRAEIPPPQENITNNGRWTIRPRRRRQTELQRLGGNQNIINQPRIRRGRDFYGTFVAGYVVDEQIPQPYLFLSEQRNWTIQNPPRNQVTLSPQILKRVNHFRRQSVVQPTISGSVLCLENGNVQVGAYELMEPHTIMFYKDSVMKLYAKNGSVFYTPETKSFSCFLMAFLRAQCLEYQFNSSNEYISVEEIEGPTITCTLPQWQDLQQDYSFVRYDVEREDFFLHLFSTQITQVELDCHPPVALVAYWELAARELEEYVKRRKGEYVDVNDLETMGTLVSELFHVVVQIFDIQTSEKRAWVFSPEPDKPIGHQIKQSENKLRMVSLLYDQGHMIPIRDIRSFITVKNKLKLRKEAYCPFCEKHGGTLMHSKKGCKSHLTECFKRNFREYWGSISTNPINLNGANACIPIKNQFHGTMKQVVPTCVYCSEYVPQDQFMNHRCFIKPKPPPKKEKDISSFYVYDIEAAQVSHPEHGVTYHVCNMLIFRKMYAVTEEEKRGIVFDNEYAFMDHLMQNDIYNGAVILAHNGGAYDHHFIVRYLERMRIAHQFVPTPNSLHKFLSVSIPEKEITFLDFIHFMPGSLKSISESLGLSVAKGDFPHRFNRSADISYRGRIPPLETEEDFWCLSTKKNENDIKELVDFYHNEIETYCVCEESCYMNSSRTHCPTCKCKLWVMKEQMYHYCKLDVDVLAEACMKYRDQLLNLSEDAELITLDIPWIPSNVEPYNFMTVPQLAMQILLQGYTTPIFRNSMDKRRAGQCSKALEWMETIAKEENKIILHRQNHHKEYFCYDLQLFADGYCPETEELFVCLNCDLYACENCCFHSIQTQESHPNYPYKTYMDVWLKTVELIEIWKYKGARVIFECQVSMSLTPYEKKCLEGKPMATFFYGGRTEVFQPYKKCLEGETIQYHDVCSLYPYVCAFEELPFDIPEYIVGYKVEADRLFHPNPSIKYWGYIRCKIRPNLDCILGLLPCRNEDGRLVFSVEEQEGCWGLNEVELAVSQGYQLVEVYEIIHWSPEKRSNQLFRGYVDYFLKMKQQAEGWIKLGGHAEMTEQEKDQLVDRLFESNGGIGFINKDKVEKNPIKRALAKLFLNSLWGKFAQKPRSKRQGIIYSANDFIQVWSNEQVKKKSILFRETGIGIFKYQYELKSDFTPENAKGNLFLAAKVTEHARCILHRQMLKIHPERVLYCDTDSILFIWPENGVDLTGIGLGKWTNEYPKKKITEFLALAPKFYMLVFAEESTLKVKGVQLTQPNIQRLDKDTLKQLLWDEYSNQEAGTKRKSEVYADHMTIFSNCHANRGVQYGVMMTRYAKKIVQFVVTKRVLIKENVPTDITQLENIKTLPYGHRLLLR